MLKILRDNRAQAVVGEYVLAFFVVMAVVTAMTVYFKRTLQARIHDANVYMVNETAARVAGFYNGPLYYEYEPYYVNTSSDVSRFAEATINLLPGGSTGIFQRTMNEETRARSLSETLPPKDFGLTN